MAIEAHNEEMTEETKRALFASWHTAAINRAKELPDLGQLLSMVGPEDEEDDLEARLMAWAYSHNARYEARKRLGVAEE